VALLPFDMGDLHFEDADVLPEEPALTALAQGAEHMREIIEEVGFSGVSLCGPQPPRHVSEKRQRELREWLKTHPKSSRHEFNEQFDPAYTDAEHDERLRSYRFVVTLGGRTAGSWVLYNVKVLTSDNERLRVSAYPAPGLALKGREPSFVREVSVVLGQFITRELPMDDGRVFDLVEWEFPTDDERYAWSGTPVWGQIMNRLRGAGIFEEVRDMGGGHRPVKRIKQRLRGARA
jgi:hypothetical protein